MKKQALIKEQMKAAEAEIEGSGDFSSSGDFENENAN